MGLGRSCNNIELRTVQFFASLVPWVAETETVFGTFRARDSQVNCIDHGLTCGVWHCEQLYRRPFYDYGKCQGVLYSSIIPLKLVEGPVSKGFSFKFSSVCVCVFFITETARKWHIDCVEGRDSPALRKKGVKAVHVEQRKAGRILF